MKEAIHHHGGMIKVWDADGRCYIATDDEFAADYGSAFPALPADITERIYEQNRRHALIRDNDVIDGGSLRWPEGNAIIADAQTLLARKNLRDETAKSTADPGQTFAQMLGEA